MDRRDGYLYGNAIRIEDKKHQVDKYRSSVLHVSRNVWIILSSRNELIDVI